MPDRKNIDFPDADMAFPGFAEQNTAFGSNLSSEVLLPQLEFIVETEIPRVGEYYADYSGPSHAQLEATEPELEELFKSSKVVSVKHEL